MPVGGCQRMEDEECEDSCRSEDIYMALKEEPSDAEDRVKTDGYITLSQAAPPRQPGAAPRPARDPSSTPGGDPPEVSALKAQLREAEERAQDVQRECEGLKEELVELQTLYDSSQRERAGLDQELRCCRAELEELVGRRGNKGESWHLAVAGAVAMTAVVALVVSGIMRAVA